MMKLRKPLAALLAGAIAASMLPAMPAFAEEGDVAINETNFPDVGFRNFLVNLQYSDPVENRKVYLDKNNDGVISLAERQACCKGNGYSLIIMGDKIRDLKGLNLLTGFSSITIEGTKVKTVDNSVLPPDLNRIDLNNCHSLTAITLKDLELKDGENYRSASINLYYCDALKEFTMTNCKGIGNIDMTGCSRLEKMTVSDCTFNTKTKIYVSTAKTKADYVFTGNTYLGTPDKDNKISIASGIKSFTESNCTGLFNIKIESLDGYFDVASAVSVDSTIPLKAYSKDEPTMQIEFTTTLINVKSVDLSTLPGFKAENIVSVSTGTLDGTILTPVKNNYNRVCGCIKYKFKKDDGTEIGTFYWNFYFVEQTQPAASANTVWVNGKDIKDNKNTPDVDETKLYKTYQYDQKGMFSGGKWCVLATPSTVADVDAFLALFKDGKLNDAGKKVAADGKKLASAKIKDGKVTVTAGKEAGNVNVWVYEVKGKNVVYNEDTDVAPMKTAVSVLMAPGGLAIADTKPENGIIAKGTSKIDLEVGKEKDLYLGDKKAKYDSKASFKVTNSDESVADASLSGDKLNVYALKVGKSNITVTCVQSGKAAKLAVTVKTPQA